MILNTGVLYSLLLCNGAVGFYNYLQVCMCVFRNQNARAASMVI